MQATVVGLPEVAETNATQILDEAVSTHPKLAAVPVTAPTLPKIDGGDDELPEADRTVPSGPKRTATGRMRAASEPAPPERKRTGGVAVQKVDPNATVAQRNPLEGSPPEGRRAGGVAVQKADPNATVAQRNPLEGAPPEGKRRTGAIPVQTDPDSTTPGLRQQQLLQTSPGVTSPTLPSREPFEWTPQKVAGLAGSVAVLLVLAWALWPAPKRPAPPVVDEPREPAPVAEAPRPKRPTAAPLPTPAPAAPTTAPTTAPTRPTLTLDARLHVIDPYGVHAPDLELDPAHKYRLRIERDDARLGTVLARLEEAGGWGVLRKMASHAALQFGGARALRLHCEPGTRFAADATWPLELVDLATREKIPVTVMPARNCWDPEVMKVLELGEGVKRRVRVPTDSSAKLGESGALRVAYLLESLDAVKTYRAGVLEPGQSVLAEGAVARFALLDSYAGDNDGRVELELLGGDTQSAGLSTGTGAQFVPTGPGPAPAPAPAPAVTP